MAKRKHRVKHPDTGEDLEVEVEDSTTDDVKAAFGRCPKCAVPFQRPLDSGLQPFHPEPVCYKIR